jgi:hypothetical protein
MGKLKEIKFDGELIIGREINGNSVIPQSISRINHRELREKNLIKRA